MILKTKKIKGEFKIFFVKNYILNGKTPVLLEDPLEWAIWMEKTDRTVNYTKLPDDVIVSTVFLGIDHSFLGNVPILF